ncbi:MAG: hypothetical protein B7Z75_05815 [Acidocella sp. 20-57-95]|nr:MAG: hypothetical protein B7Z75_05815 [Acidocella sp. 20-57-95]OYV61115.1 MAG: hypothetical protein B7Z71_05185 [Acidocella sp. 21-58-7]HQT65204.1 hypothetical protein [Acidocella sp.]HQU04517.1 hypothetical protein [Acidocella sp.]
MNRSAIIGVIVVLIVGFFAVPMIAGGTTNTCQALEKHNVSATASNIAGSTSGIVHDTINNIGQSMASGQVTTSMMAQDHPNTPSVVSCSYYYWKDIL